MRNYPDVSELIKQEEAHRRALASLSFEEKIEMAFRLQARRKLIKSGRAASYSQESKTERA
jgi:hypothetical protein